MSVKKFKSLPVEIEAIQRTGKNDKEIINWILENGGDGYVWCLDLEGMRVGDGPFSEDWTCPSGGVKAQHLITIYTEEGPMDCPVGSWVIRGTIGEFYPCLDEVFQVKYTEVVDASEQDLKMNDGVITHA